MRGPRAIEADEARQSGGDSRRQPAADSYSAARWVAPSLTLRRFHHASATTLEAWLGSLIVLDSGYVDATFTKTPRRDTGSGQLSHAGRPPAAGGHIRERCLGRSRLFQLD